MTITNKMLLLVVGIILLTLSGVVYFHQSYTRAYLEDNQLKWVSTVIKGMSESISRDTINHNKLAVRDLLKRLVQDKTIEYAFVTDLDGELFTHSFDGGLPRFLLESLQKHGPDIHGPHFFKSYDTKQGIIIEYDAPLVEGLEARVHLGVNQSELNTVLDSITNKAIFFISLLGITSFMIAVFVGRKISLPLSQFTSKLTEYQNGDIKEFPNVSSNDPDIKKLIHVFGETMYSIERAGKKLQNTQMRLLKHREQSPIAIIDFAPDFTILDWNPAAEKVFGYSYEEAVNKSAFDLIVPGEFKGQGEKIFDVLLKEKGGSHSINKNITKDGKEIICEWFNTPLYHDDGSVIGVASYAQDVTQQQQQEEQLRRSQKMDALGKLTGGVAHDYNNMLGVILGYAELLKARFGDNEKLNQYVTEIENAGKRGVSLTSKLLSFSRQTVTEADDIDLNQLLLDDRNMLEKTLTVRVNLEYQLDESLWPIHVDKSDMEDVILNMSINAMHAMHDSGTLTFITGNRQISSDDARALELRAGDYVSLELIDTGEGMDDETLQRIFEPFFSTKGAGGTGLGLSQVYGFVKRSGGAIQVDSEPMQGTRFVLLFPRSHDEKPNEAEHTVQTLEADVTGSESILVVDDEPALLELLQASLTNQGYRIYVANSGKQALNILQKENIHLVITDIIMPEMDGYELSDIILKEYPDVKIQLVSGYNDTIHTDKINTELNKQLMYKPLQLSDLFGRIRELLG